MISNKQSGESGLYPAVWMGPIQVQELHWSSSQNDRDKLIWVSLTPMRCTTEYVSRIKQPLPCSHESSCGGLKKKCIKVPTHYKWKPWAASLNLLTKVSTSVCFPFVFSKILWSRIITCCTDKQARYTFIAEHSYHSGCSLYSCFMVGVYDVSNVECVSTTHPPVQPILMSPSHF